jgi:hypothetical protein
MPRPVAQSDFTSSERSRATIPFAELIARGVYQLHVSSVHHRARDSHCKQKDYFRG